MPEDPPDGPVDEPAAVPADVTGAAAAAAESEEAAGPRPRRRRRTPGGRRHQYGVRFADAENARIAQEAAAAGMTVPNWIAQTVLRVIDEQRGWRPAGAPLAQRRTVADELLGTRRRLGPLGRNINQIAVRVHATGQAPAELAPALAAVNAELARLDALLNRLEGRR